MCRIHSVCVRLQYKGFVPQVIYVSYKFAYTNCCFDINDAYELSFYKHAFGTFQVTHIYFSYNQAVPII